MRKKELKIVVTFHTTAEAMAMEKACLKEKVAGRIIPVPRSITAGCGLAWASPLGEEERIRRVLTESKIEIDAIRECMV